MAMLTLQVSNAQFDYFCKSQIFMRERSHYILKTSIRIQREIMIALMHAKTVTPHSASCSVFTEIRQCQFYS